MKQSGSTLSGVIVSYTCSDCEHRNRLATFKSHIQVGRKVKYVSLAGGFLPSRCVADHVIIVSATPTERQDGVPERLVVPELPRVCDGDGGPPEDMAECHGAVSATSPALRQSLRQDSDGDDECTLLFGRASLWVRTSGIVVRIVYPPGECPTNSTITVSYC